MSKRCIFIILLCFLLTTGCGKAKDSQTADLTTLTSTAITETTEEDTTTATTTTTVVETTTTTTTTATEIEQKETTTQADSTENAEAEADTESYDTYSCETYGCSISVPSDWEATSGVEGTDIVEDQCMFQPTDANGTGLIVSMSEEPEDADIFSAITGEAVAEAYGDNMDNAQVVDFAQMQVEGKDACKTVLTGQVEDVDMTLTQVFINGDHLYSLTFVNTGTEQDDYGKILEACFHLQ